jgi:hypothetical protein
LAERASTVATKNAAFLVRTNEKSDFKINKINTAAETHGRVWAVTAGICKPENSRTRFGWLPEVKKIVVDVTINPIARIPAKSRNERRPFRKVKKYHLDRS